MDGWMDGIVLMMSKFQRSVLTYMSHRIGVYVFLGTACREKVEAGVHAMTQQGQSILHTAPHHDDIMLSYHGAMHQLLGRPQAVHTPVTWNEVTNTGVLDKSTSLPLPLPDADNSSAALSYGLASTNSKESSGNIQSQQASTGKALTHRAQSLPQPLPLPLPLPGISSKGHLCGDIHSALGEEHGENVNHFAYLTSGFHSVSIAPDCTS